MGVINWPS
jgi:hypothetical protein